MVWCFASQDWYFKVLPDNKTVVIWYVRKRISDLIDEYDFAEHVKVAADVSATEWIADMSILDNAFFFS